MPVPELVHVEDHDDHLLRIFTWIDGHRARELVGDDVRSARFLRSVGVVLRRLHAVGLPGFSSRLDGSAPRFGAWQDYVSHRVTQVRARCEATRAVDPELLDRVTTMATDLAIAVSDSAEPVLCHRDLHADNLIVSDTGALIGILDWDGAEAWDRAGDWFKIEFELLRLLPDPGHTLAAAYLDGEPAPTQWLLRRRLVHLLEALNILPNATTNQWDAGFADRARAHLADLLDGVAL